MRFATVHRPKRQKRSFSRHCTHRCDFEAPSLACQVNVIVPKTLQVTIEGIYTDATGLGADRCDFSTVHRPKRQKRSFHDIVPAGVALKRHHWPGR